MSTEEASRLAALHRHNNDLIAGRYQIVRTLAGGMGVIHLCLDVARDGFPVALKTFRPELLSDPAARDRFLREATLWVQLGFHPNIVQAYSVEYLSDTREVLLALELIPAPDGFPDASLRSRLLSGRGMPTTQILPLALGIVRGMKYATSRFPDLVHRDIKPENILIDPNGAARVSDFGLAASAHGLQITQPALSSSSNLPRDRLTQGVVGTPLYMSPEQWGREQLDARSDIYSFGCMLFEMLTGAPAIVGEHLPSLAEGHLAGLAERSAANLGTPELLKELVYCCVRRLPEDRFANWAVVETALLPIYRSFLSREAPEDEAPTDVSLRGQIQAAQAYLAIGAAYLDIGQYALGADYFQRALQVGESQNQLHIQASALGNLGFAYMKQGDARRALQHYQSALALDRQLQDGYGACARLGNMGGAYQRLGNIPQALQCFQSALELAEELGQVHFIASQLGNLGVLHAENGNVKEAINYYKRAIDLFQQAGDMVAAAANLMNLGNAYFSVSDLPAAQQVLIQALKFSSEMGDPGLQGTVLANLANVYLAQGNLPKAIECLEKALELAQQTKSLSAQAGAHVGLGLAAAAKGNATLASVHFHRGLSLAETLGDQRLVQSAVTGLGQIALGKGDAARAADYLRRSLAISVSLSDEISQAKAQGNLGVAYLMAGQSKEAEAALTEAYQLAEKTEAIDVQGRAVWALGLLREAQRQNRAAVELMSEAVGIFRRANLPEYQQALEYLQSFKKRYRL